MKPTPQQSRKQPDTKPRSTLNRAANWSKKQDHLYIRSDGAVSNKAVFVALAILPAGTRDVLDILIAVVDGLKGFAQAIEAAFPKPKSRPASSTCSATP